MRHVGDCKWAERACCADVGVAPGRRIGEAKEQREVALVLDRGAPSATTLEAPALLADGTPFGSTGRLRRGVLVVAGILCVGLGVVGLVVPVLPTTPFLLLAVGLGVTVHILWIKTRRGSTQPSEEP